MFARMSIMVLALLAIGQIGQVAAPVWENRGVVTGDLVAGKPFPFLLGNAASRSPLVERPGCMAALICTLSCPFCRERARLPDAGEADWILFGDSKDAAAFSSSTGVSLDHVWLPGPMVNGSAESVRLTGMSATPTGVVILDGVLTQIHHAPGFVADGAALSALCEGEVRVGR